MSDDQIQPILRDLLTRVPTMALATVDEHGKPHACNLNFVADDACNLYYVSHPDVAHSRHIAERPDVAGAVYPQFNGPAEIRGAQFHGVCRASDPADFDTIWPMYLAKFPYATQFEERVRAERFYCVSPTWFRTIDNSVHFGFRVESDWPPR